MAAPVCQQCCRAAVATLLPGFCSAAEDNAPPIVVTDARLTPTMFGGQVKVAAFAVLLVNSGRLRRSILPTVLLQRLHVHSS